jgi:hypothetical protein
MIRGRHRCSKVHVTRRVQYPLGIFYSGSLNRFVKTVRPVKTYVRRHPVDCPKIVYHVPATKNQHSALAERRESGT